MKTFRACPVLLLFLLPSIVVGQGALDLRKYFSPEDVNTLPDSLVIILAEEEAGEEYISGLRVQTMSFNYSEVTVFTHQVMPWSFVEMAILDAESLQPVTMTYHSAGLEYHMRFNDRSVIGSVVLHDSTFQVDYEADGPILLYSSLPLLLKGMNFEPSMESRIWIYDPLANKRLEIGMKVLGRRVINTYGDESCDCWEVHLAVMNGDYEPDRPLDEMLDEQEIIDDEDMTGADEYYYIDAETKILRAIHAGPMRLVQLRR